MEFIDIGVRVRLDRLRVEQTDDGVVAGSADEPYLWFFVLTADGTTIFENHPETAEVRIRSTSPAPGNLGAPSAGVVANQTIPIPSSVGTMEFLLRGNTGTMIDLTQYATLGVLVAAIEHDESRAQDVIALHARIVERCKTLLDDELRRILQEVIKGQVPTVSEVRERLEAQVNRQVINDIIDDFKSEIIGQPINALNQDVFVGYAKEPVVSFPDLLANALTGIPVEVKLGGNSGGETVQGGGLVGGSPPARYRVFGTVERTDIQEPPTVGLVRLPDGRVRVCGRSNGKAAVLFQRSANGWESSETALGTEALSSGPTMAVGADGDRMYVAGHGLDHFIKLRYPGSGGQWEKIGGHRFASGAAVACSADGKLVFLMATGRDRNVFATFNFQGGSGWNVDWFPVGIKSIATPALACSADGTKLHVVTLGEDRRLNLSIFDVGLHKLAPKITVPLSDKLFRSSPACACSADGKRVWFAAVGDDEVLRVNKAAAEPGGAVWTELTTGIISAPALSCSPDGNQVHVAGIDKHLHLLHRWSSDAGATWPKRGEGASFEVVTKRYIFF